MNASAVIFIKHSNFSIMRLGRINNILLNPRPRGIQMIRPVKGSVSSSGQGVTICDKLRCVCDRTTAECMAAAPFNHSLPTQQCRGPGPPCRRAGRLPKPQLPPQSSEESKEPQGRNSDVEEQDASEEPNSYKVQDR